jgi:hypothetical protein
MSVMSVKALKKWTNPMPSARIAIESVSKILIMSTKCQWFWLNFSKSLKLFLYDPRMEIILDIGSSLAADVINSGTGWGLKIVKMAKSDVIMG